MSMMEKAYTKFGLNTWFWNLFRPALLVVVSSRVVHKSFFDVIEFVYRTAAMAKDKTCYYVERGNSCGVLLYNPIQQVVILVEQFRPAMWGKAGGGVIETVAGRVEEGEDARNTALREVLEESGYVVNTLESVGALFPSPGTSSEIVHTFVAFVTEKHLDADKYVQPDENIRLHEIPVDTFFKRLRANTYTDPKIIQTGYWLLNDTQRFNKKENN